MTPRRSTYIARGLALGLAMLGISLSPVAAFAQSNPHLRARWHLDDPPSKKAVDSSGNGHDGTVSGAKSVPGKFGRALQFGKGDYMKVPNSGHLEPQHVSVEAWVKGNPPGEFVYILGKGGHGCSFSSYALYTAGSTGMFFYIASGKAYYRSANAGPAVWDDQWHHIAGTYDGEFVRLYLDGVEILPATETFSAPIKYALLDHDDIFVGSYRAGGCDLDFSNAKPGTIDEVAIWDYALSCSEVSEHATATGPGVP